jgi:CBS domain-containing protein
MADHAETDRPTTTPGRAGDDGARYGFLAYRVHDVMSQPVTVPDHLSLREVEEVFEEHGFNALPVVDDAGKLVGLTTSLDLLRAFSFSLDTVIPPYAEAMRRPVRDVMTPVVSSVGPDTPLTRVLERLVDSGKKSFPVVDQGRLVGMVAREDIMRALRKADDRLRPGEPDRSAE